MGPVIAVGKDGAPAPLFDRLVDLHPDVPSEPRPFRTLTRDQLRDSVRREVERLLNTRAPLTQEELAGRTRTVIDYGLPDFGTFSVTSGEDRYRLGVSIAETITIYEPRLQDVVAKVDMVRREEGVLAVNIEATIVAGRIVEPVSFPVLIRQKPEGGSGEPESVTAGHEG